MPHQSPYMPRSELFRVNSISEESCLPILQWAMPIIAEELYPGFDGIGCVIVAGGKYLRTAYASVKCLREFDVDIPVQIWHLPNESIEGSELFDGLGVSFHDLGPVFDHEYSLVRTGWAGKMHAIKACPFRHVLLLDADCIPAQPPNNIFETDQYGENGLILWPDLLLHTLPSAWPCLGLKYQSIPEHESGQVMIDKERHWPTIKLATWMASHEIFHKLLFGDKNMLGVAATKVGLTFYTCQGTLWKSWGMEHMAPNGTLAFQHGMHVKRSQELPPKAAVKYLKEFDDYEISKPVMTV